MLCVHIGNIGSYKPPMDDTNLDALGGSVTFIEINQSPWIRAI